MKKDRIQLLKEHLKVKNDEQLFYTYDAYDKFDNTPTSNVSNIEKYTNTIKYINDYLSNIKSCADSIVDDKMLEIAIDDATSDIEYELNDIENILTSAIANIKEFEIWGENWKDIGMEFLNYMAEHHADKLDDVGILEESIDENTFKSIEGINKFNS